jgi:nucleoside-diphosphate-sugar epimerase
MINHGFTDDCYSGVRAIVLGASGFIGRWVARSLCERGARLYLVVRDRAGSERIFCDYSVRGEIVELDIGSVDAARRLVEIVEAVGPSITFNLAGYGVDRAERDEETAYRINADLVQALCEAIVKKRDAAWQGRDLIHAGSALEYGEIGGDLAEDSPPRPTTLYGKSKLAGTRSLARCCRAYRIEGVTARLFTVYGPGEHAGRLVPSLIEASRAGEPIPLTDGRQRRDFTYVADVAEGLLRLGLSLATPGETVNVATGRLTTVREFIETAAGLLKIPDEKLLFGALPTRPEEMNHAPVTLERLRRLTSWVPPTTISDGIRNALEFHSKVGSGRPPIAGLQ